MVGVQMQPLKSKQNSVTRKQQGNLAPLNHLSQKVKDLFQSEINSIWNVMNFGHPFFFFLLNFNLHTINGHTLVCKKTKIRNCCPQNARVVAAKVRSGA